LIVQLTNTVVFFFSGAACVNFFIRSTRALEHNGYGAALAVAFWRLPLIFISIFIVRMLLIALFSPMLKMFGAQMDWRVSALSACVAVPCLHALSACVSACLIRLRPCLQWQPYMGWMHCTDSCEYLTCRECFFAPLEG
jgi:hypothetical protein